MSRRAALAALAGSVAMLWASAGRAATKLRVGKAVSENPGYIPLDVGMRYGFFDKHGVAVEKIDFTGGAKLTQALAGAVDIALSGGPDMAFAAKGAPQLAVATITSSPAFMGISVGAQSTARSADDLRGKKIGVTGMGSLTYWLIEELNRVKGWTAEGHRAVPVAIGGSPTAAFAGLKSGAVDGSVGSVEVGYQLEERQEGRLLLSISDYVKTLELFVIFTSTALIHQNPEARTRIPRRLVRDGSPLCEAIKPKLPKS
jgi:NitT/TauT family transport system substrate-binding protein